MKKYEVMLGMNINSAVAEMVALANKTGETIESEFNDNPIVANPGDNSSDIVKKYDKECAERAKAYKNSPECKLAEEKAKAKQLQRDADLALALTLVGAQIKLSLKDEEVWNQAVEKNTDSYGCGIIRYANKWACLMEGHINNGTSLADCAERLSYLADNEGITGFMYGCAVGILSQVWVHGEELRRWHNIKTQIGDEGEKANESGGTLNPALLIIGNKE